MLYELDLNKVEKPCLDVSMSRISSTSVQLFKKKPGSTYTKPSYFTSNVNIYDHSYAKYTWLSQNLRKHIVRPLLNSYKVPSFEF